MIFQHALQQMGFAGEVIQNTRLGQLNCFGDQRKCCSLESMLAKKAGGGCQDFLGTVPPLSFFLWLYFFWFM